MDINKQVIITQAVKDGDWVRVGNLVTRNDLVDWIMEETNPDTNDKKSILKKAVPCPCCGQDTKMYPTSLTHRQYKYLLNLIWLSSNDKDNDGYIHHSVIHDRTMELMTYDKGKRKGKGIDFTAYSQLTRYPWDLMESKVSTEDKSKRDGYFKPTERGIEFCRGKLALPDKIYIHNKEVVRYSNNLVYCFNVKDINFHQLLDLYKTW